MMDRSSSSSNRSTIPLRSALLPPAAAFVVGVVVSVFLPFGVGVLIATVIPTCVLAVILGLIVWAIMRRRSTHVRASTLAFLVSWLIAIVAMTVLARLTLHLTGISVSQMPIVERVLLDLAANLPISLVLFGTMATASIVLATRWGPGTGSSSE